MSQINEPTVTIQDGKLKGTTGKNLDGETFLSFFGIPYAKPPIKELRFKPPQPVEPWQGVKDATKVGSPSISRDDFDFSQIVGSEDCLNVNVYTKKLPSSNSKLRPVLVYFHGGGFVWGSNRPRVYGPTFLLIKDIVLVNVNYRLGALGFLSIDDSEVSGNNGLKDQNLALKWVQRNIKSFNGDPNNVTIFGESAGGGSVHTHILSPASKGLFHKAILQSSSALNPWFWGSKNNATELVKQLGKTAKNELEALEILKQVPGLDIFAAQEKLFDTLYASYKRPFSTVIESQNETAFLTKHPREIMAEGSFTQVPMMIGYTDKEGILIDFIAGNNLQTPPFTFEEMIPFDLNIPKGSAESKRISAIFEKLYSGDPKNYDVFTDSCFLAGVAEALLAHLEVAKEPIYFYRMSISTQVNYLKRATGKLDQPGACHADDLGYLWHMDVSPEIKPGSKEDKYIRTFVELWTNFAEFGNPTPNDKLNISWQPVESKDKLNLLDIGEKVQMRDMPERKRMEVWCNLYKK